ncbi:MAG TPA: HNH endonuclease [Burkholderiales bacterium]|nr:HNH endonuclease [Burkholderiales bacterium]
MTKSRHINTPRYSWTEEATALVVRDYANRPATEIAAQLGVKVHVVYKRAEKLGLKKSAEFYVSQGSGRISALLARGIDHRFKKGWPSARKGQPFPTRGRMGLTQFKKGQVPHNARYQLGDRRINSEGYLDRKISNDRKGALNWTAEHRLVWIESNGPIPPGHVVAFKEGRRTTDLEKITVDALELITNKENLRRRSVHALYPKEVVQLIQLKGAIRRQINKRERNASHD